MTRSVAARVSPRREDEFALHFPRNGVQNAYPSLLIFIPISVVRQYIKPLSFYFLAVCALAFVKELSPFDPFTQLIPVLIVLSISVFRECMQEIARQKEDKRVNSQKTRINRDGKWVEVDWEDVIVGDVILIPSDSPCPADIVVVATSSPGNSAYIQTTNLDGETNFKPRFGIDKAIVTLDLMTSPTLPPGHSRRPELIIHAEAPRSDLDWFQADAVFHVSQAVEVSVQETEPVSPSGDSSLPELVPVNTASSPLNTRSIRLEPIEVSQLTVKNFIPREAVVKGTEWVIGVVIYTGLETKVLLGQQKPAYKVSKIDRITNQLVLLIMFLQIAVSSMVAAGTYASTWIPKWWLPDDQHSTFVKLLFSGLSSMLLITMMIPISLVISLEIAKVYQAKFMESDVLIPGTKTPSQALNDDLGQIGYILSDKTGTLTTNTLVLKECTIGGTVYPDLVSIRRAFDGRNEKVTMFVNALSVCHDIAPNWSGDIAESGAMQMSSIWAMKRQTNKEREIRSGSSTPGGEIASGMTYCGESPDEICLVQSCAKDFGQILTKRTQSGITITSPSGTVVRWGIERFYGFDNLRRRSSVIVSRPEIYGPDKFIVFVKGSDDAVLPKCQFGEDERNSTENSLKIYAKKSLRTLVLGYKFITRSELQKLELNHGNKRSDLIEAVESGLTLLGCTGTEDRLQDGVQGSIHRMRVAGIAIWMITGDKLDTAVEISKSANLLTPEMETVLIDIEDIPVDISPSHSMLSTVSHFPKWLNVDQRDVCLSRLETALRQSNQVAAIITGRSIRHLVTDGTPPDTRLIDCLLMCKSVVVCRSTKDQKAQVVRLIQVAVKREALVLSIGDGANDVPMIKQADVGVGIEGKEGRQAAQNADYVITQFSHLERLLLFHGRLNYVRTSKMVLYFLFKNLVLTFPFVLHQIISAMYSSSVLVSSTIGMSFNTLLTSVPVFAIGLMERDVSPNDRLVGFGSVSAQELAQLYPRLYMTGRQNRMFTRRLLGTLFVAAALVGTWIYMFSILPTTDVYAVNGDGFLTDHWSMAEVYFIGVFVVDTAAAVLISDGVTMPMVLAIVYSAIACLGFFFSDALDTNNPAGLGLYEFMTQTWVFVPIVSMICVPPIALGVGLKAWRSRFNPTARMVWQEAKYRADRRRAVLKKARKAKSMDQSQSILKRNQSLTEHRMSFIYDPDNMETQNLLPKP
jgi:phospholipid-translocating P-type ATPase (flippase)